MIELQTELVFGLIVFALALTYMMLMSRVKMIGIISLVPLLVLALYFNNLMSLGFVSLMVFNSWYSILGSD